MLLILAVRAEILLWHLSRQIRSWEHLLRVIFLRQCYEIYWALERGCLWPEISSQQLLFALRRFQPVAVMYGEGMGHCSMYSLAFWSKHCSYCAKHSCLVLTVQPGVEYCAHISSSVFHLSVRASCEAFWYSDPTSLSGTEKPCGLSTLSAWPGPDPARGRGWYSTPAGSLEGSMLGWLWSSLWQIFHHWTAVSCGEQLSREAML